MKIATQKELQIMKRKCDYCGGFAFLRDYRGLKFCFGDWWSSIIHHELRGFWSGLFWEIKNTRIY